MRGENSHSSITRELPLLPKSILGKSLSGAGWEWRTLAFGITRELLLLPYPPSIHQQGILSAERYEY
jgi:hypothetical protein